jgi:hypothetical protein
VTAVAPDDDLVEPLLVRVLEDRACRIADLLDGPYRRSVIAGPPFGSVEQALNLGSCTLVPLVEPAAGRDVIARVGGVEPWRTVIPASGKFSNA